MLKAIWESGAFGPLVATERVIGPIVNDQSNPDGESVCPASGKNWFSESELIFAPNGLPYCPQCEEVIMQRVK